MSVSSGVRPADLGGLAQMSRKHKSELRYVPFTEGDLGPSPHLLMTAGIASGRLFDSTFKTEINICTLPSLWDSFECGVSLAYHSVPCGLCSAWQQDVFGARICGDSEVETTWSKRWPSHYVSSTAGTSSHQLSQGGSPGVDSYVNGGVLIHASGEERGTEDASDLKLFSTQ